MTFRIERDPLGEFQVPADAYYGVQTARAVQNFPVSGLTAPESLVTATVLVKRAAAEANRTLGRLEPAIADAIIAAADEVLSGKLRNQFVVDVYQAGAGTSHNMNTNEVLANRAAEILGGSRGTYDRVHPNDHVNMGQSKNDVFPLATRTGSRVEPAKNRFRVTQSMGDVVTYSAAMRRLSVELGKICSDLRLLSMGPRAGIAELRLPAVQPGSSIMPGKVNPSVPEMVNQVCYQVFGCDVTVSAAAEAGQLELNVMMPVIAWNALHAQKILTNASRVLRTRTIEGLEADEARARELMDRSTAVATALSPYIGYAATAEIAKAAVASGRAIRELVIERGLMKPEQLDRVLSAQAMTQPGVAGEEK